MWRAFAVFRCPHCGVLRKTAHPVYKFDVDASHFYAFEQSHEMIAGYEKARTQTCANCGGQIDFQFSGWEDQR